MSLEEVEGYKDSKAFADEVLEALLGGGYNAKEAVALSLYLYVPSESSAKYIAGILEDEGYEVDVEEPLDTEPRWCCWCNLTVELVSGNLEIVGDRFLTLAKEFDGVFDGWETNPYEIEGGIESIMSQIENEPDQENEEKDISKN